MPGTMGTIPHAGSILEKPGVVPIYNTASKPLFTSGLTGGGRIIFSSVERKRLFSPYAKGSETSLAVTSDGEILSTFVNTMLIFFQ